MRISALVRVFVMDSILAFAGLPLLTMSLMILFALSLISDRLLSSSSVSVATENSSRICLALRSRSLRTTGSTLLLGFCAWVFSTASLYVAVESAILLVALETLPTLPLMSFVESLMLSTSFWTFSAVERVLSAVLRIVSSCLKIEEYMCERSALMLLCMVLTSEFLSKVLPLSLSALSVSSMNVRRPTSSCLTLPETFSVATICVRLRATSCRGLSLSLTLFTTFTAGIVVALQVVLAMVLLAWMDIICSAVLLLPVSATVAQTWQVLLAGWGNDAVMVSASPVGGGSGMSTSVGVTLVVFTGKYV